MVITEIEKIFKTGNQQQIEMMARRILTQGRSHMFMQDLSQYAVQFNDLLSKTDPEAKDYLALVHILAEHLKEIKEGACPCSIIQKAMYNNPERLNGILEVLDERFIVEEYCIIIYSKCLACSKEYESKILESGLGQTVIWNERPSIN
ncbi:MAG: hypothetical protein EOO43_07435 [Flavobacterium sp.]|nr:MAG: hypothetical protein EOO43_07435 [Flavobacterium sp.]